MQRPMFHPLSSSYSQNLHNTHLSHQLLRQHNHSPCFDTSVQYNMQQSQVLLNSNNQSTNQWSKKRAMIEDISDDDHYTGNMSKKKSKNIELDSQSLFPWSGLHTSEINSKQLYFGQDCSSIYGPATPPLESAPFQASASFNTPQSSLTRDLYKNEPDPNMTREGEYHASNIGMEAYIKEQIYNHEGLSIRSLSPAPSSPSGSINGAEGEENNEHEWNSDKIYEGVTSTIKTSVKKPRDKRYTFVMGFRAGCERCLRREKGHFAHLE